MEDKCFHNDDKRFSDPLEYVTSFHKYITLDPGIFSSPQVDLVNLEILALYFSPKHFFK